VAAKSMVVVMTESYRPNDLSYTALHSLMTCEYSFYLRYVQRVQLVESSASIYGTAVHKAIKLAYDNNLSEKELVKIFKQEWIQLASGKDVVFQHEKDYLNKLNDGQLLVADYYKKFIKNVPPPKRVECFIGRKDGVKLGNYNLVAVFDQITHDNKVVDLKTGVKPTQNELDLDLQFTIYSYVYRQLYGEEESGLVLRHLGTMKDLITVRTDEDFAVLFEEVAKLDAKLKSNVFLRNLGRDCARCYFLKHCLGKEKQFGRWNKWS
jgi:hypothetical protein